MNKTLALLLLLSTTFAFAQQSTLQGNLINERGEPLMYATAVLLNPLDSTMANYAVSDEDGHFFIKNIKKGTYILQAGYMGYESFFKKIDHPMASGNDLGPIVMLSKVQTLGEYQVNADRIPILIKKDTVEYVANAFKTKTDAVVEELLKKLPGIEVDRAGNIKAHGEDVQRVMVDGKEFFSNDLTVATKNLPADAIDRVQVYNKKSDETELTGIDDGSYSKTINLVLKEGKKSAYFGDVTGGYGTDEHYQAGGKLFRFTRKYQFAALGMVNNIGKSGFSFQDYLDFKGGLQGMMSSGGGSANVGLDDDARAAIFGSSTNGLVSSGAAGLNFTHEAKINNRFNVSYLGNGSNIDLLESTHRENFLEEGSYTEDKEIDQYTENRIHRLNYTWRNRIDSTQNLYLYGGASLNDGSSESNSFTESFENELLMNDLYSLTTDEAKGMSANSRATYLKTGKKSMKLFKITGNVSYSQSLDETEWENVTRFLTGNEIIYDDRYQEDESINLNYSTNASATFKLNNLLYLVPSITAGIVDESLNRFQSLSDGSDVAEILMSPNFNREYLYAKSGLSLKRNTQKTQIDLTARIENLTLRNTLNNTVTEDENYMYFLPSMSWRYEYSTGKRLSFNYNSNLRTPSARQLLPVANTANPLQIYSGNSELIPEYSHNVRLSWLMYDQFSQTSIFASMSGTYTMDKINFSRTILDNLSQQINLINVEDDYRAALNFDFTTPFRKLGIDLNARLSESWNRGLSYVNGAENINTNFSHTLSLYLNNRKKDKWDLMVGGRIQISDVKYSLQESLNRQYVNTSAYSDLSYTPNDKWYFLFSADITRYDEQTFGEAVNIPILRAEISRYFLTGKRAVITLSAYDLLDQNKGLERISEMNYLLERTTNVLGRYAMLTFKYRLNKFDKKAGMKIDVRRRR